MQAESSFSEDLLSDISFRPLASGDRKWVEKFIQDHWGSDLMIVHGESYTISSMAGFVAEQQHERLGLVTYRIDGRTCEIMSLNSLRAGHGIGTALIEAVKDAARAAGCRRVCLTTTNDNIDALRFYQRRGFALVELRRNAVTESRKLKPQIPLLGEHGIPLRDELELEIELDSPASS